MLLIQGDKMKKKININGKEIELTLGTTHRLEIEGTDLHIDCCLKTKDRMYQDPHWLREQYLERGLSMATIADMCSVTPMAILNWLKKHNIETRPRGSQPQV